MTVEEVTVELEAMDPGALLYNLTPPDLWLRHDSTYAGWCAMVKVRGPRDQVEAFVRLHWGDEILDDLDPTEGPLGLERYFPKEAA